jgi:hypothetical protein
VAQSSGVEECVEERLRLFRLYDRSVDIVSAFEMLFTASKTALPTFTHHFERFPRLVANDGNEATPDFTVVHDDSRGLAAEIAYLPLNDQGVDALCRQILRYDALADLQAGDGTLRAVSSVDVLLLVPQAIGPDAVRRIIHDRLLDPEHFYKPSVAPIVVQFGFDEDRYTLQRLLDPENGNFRDDGRPQDARLSEWFKGSVFVRPERFREIKAQRAFVNDPIEPVYLATHLWAKTFATLAADVDGPLPKRIEVMPVELAARLRDDHGFVRKSDVDKALGLLRLARLAEPIPNTGAWTVAWDELRPRHKDAARLIAERACRQPSTGPVTKLRKLERAKTIPPRPPTLFDDIDNQDSQVADVKLPD